MKERRKHKCGSRKDKGMKHSYVERLAALMLCAALLVSNAVISRADDEAEVPQMVETVNEERNADRRTGSGWRRQPERIAFERK